MSYFVNCPFGGFGHKTSGKNVDLCHIRVFRVILKKNTLMSDTISRCLICLFEVYNQNPLIFNL